MQGVERCESTIVLQTEKIDKCIGDRCNAEQSNHARSQPPGSFQILRQFHIRKDMNLGALAYALARCHHGTDFIA
jgi:hypothetical protein